eukprot:GFUD01121933.1.p1 GENE.GFUD01121933.1~~GFUD01121933.1.p1  ORF type:complete len:167 (-),score=40.44 GFUD01121933.1:107-607(-)
MQQAARCNKMQPLQQYVFNIFNPKMQPLKPLQQYVLERVKTGDLDNKTLDDEEVFKVLETTIESVYYMERFPAAVKRKIFEKFGDTVAIGLAEIGKNIFIRIEGIHCTLGYKLLVVAKFQGIRSLQDLAAHQVACTIRNNLVSLEQLPIPKSTKKVVAKFVETANI